MSAKPSPSSAPTPSPTPTTPVIPTHTAKPKFVVFVSERGIEADLGHSDLASLGRYCDELPGELEVAMRTRPLLRRRAAGE